ncbi:hypothetical protein [Streptomyces sp. NPDC021020]|uniref:hypothetical protein n=1 Tax=Streptomyces sp. NPDC021020 TaxID=3365109 RepID=UPI0037B5624F
MIGLMFAGTGVAHATGSTGCTSTGYVWQYTKYHGLICYTNTGFDDLHTSGFWTTELWTGNNYGCLFVADHGPIPFGSNQDIYFNSYPSGVVSVTALWIIGNTTGSAPGCD